MQQLLIWYFIKKFKVDLSEAILERPHHYRCFNDFFTRKIKPQLRPTSDDPRAVGAPCDGVVQQHGAIENGSLLQAKGIYYPLKTLVCSQLPYQYFATFYLSPRHYHRSHAPLHCDLVEVTHVPGATYSVAPTAVATIKHLYLLNERLILHFSTANLGGFCIVMVGAQNVSSITTPWFTERPAFLKPQQPHLMPISFPYRKGQEIASFNMGSTVVMLFERLPSRTLLSVGQEVLVNQHIAQYD